jgi:Family of unknown function (DUF5641)
MLLRAKNMLPRGISLLHENTNYQSRRGRLIENITESFWDRLKSLYLSLLIARKERQQSKGSQFPLGDIVTVMSKTKPFYWPIGRLVKGDLDNLHSVQQWHIKLAKNEVITCSPDHISKILSHVNEKIQPGECSISYGEKI